MSCSQPRNDLKMLELRPDMMESTILTHLDPSDPPFAKSFSFAITYN
jgi:hypothetical protein